MSDLTTYECPHCGKEWQMMYTRPALELECPGCGEIGSYGESDDRIREKLGDE